MVPGKKRTNWFFEHFRHLLEAQTSMVPQFDHFPIRLGQLLYRQLQAGGSLVGPFVVSPAGPGGFQRCQRFSLCRTLPL